jgi:hypothetical protein
MVNSGLGGEVVSWATFKELVQKYVSQHKEGGIIGFTGPAWLDGTPDAPETVLTQDQTKDMFTTIEELDRGIWPNLPEELPALDRLRKSVPKLKQYKTGGIADFTGPAWLDGTKSKPEIILNQKDTQNFLSLRDILAEIMNGNNLKKADKEEGSGDNYYDIDINVEKIDSDYDVE